MMTLPLAAAALAACVALAPEAERVTARDLAQMDPAFAALAPGTSFGYAPVPGARRVFHAAALARAAARHGLAGWAPRDLCAERATRPVDGARLLEAMKKSMPEAEIQLLDFG